MRTSNKLAHCPPIFPFEKNELLIGNRSISEIAGKVGQTPFYVYDKNIVRQRIEYLKGILPDQVSLHYAMKANPMPEVVQYITSMVDGIDVASAQELDIAMQTNTLPQNISFAGPGKNAAELNKAIQQGITINVESENELNRIIEISQQRDLIAHIAIRVNPNFELKASAMKMAGKPSQFGIDSEIIPELFPILHSNHIHFRGFHIFSGSQNLNADMIVEAQTKTVELALELAKVSALPIELLNLGGGFGIPYFAGEKRLDLAPIANNLAGLIDKIKTRLPGVETVIELGRYIVGEAGIYICEVIDKKISRGHTFLITNGGMHHHLAASGNLGQVIRKNYPVIIANKVNSDETENVSIVGPLCTPLDLLADNMELPVADIGDLVGVLQSGAYGYSASPVNFLSHPCPIEILM